MNFLKPFFHFFILITLPLNLLSTEVLDVCPTCSYTTISAALNAARPNNLIRVFPGYYRESNLVVDKPLTIKGVRRSGMPEPTIDCGGCNTNQDRRFITIRDDNFSHNDEVIIEGFKIINGCALRNDGIGGAIKIARSTPATPNLCPSQKVIIRDCSFQSNLALLGGAIGIDMSNCISILIDNCSFSNNQGIDTRGTLTFGKGGAVYAQTRLIPLSIPRLIVAVLDITNSVFKSNNATNFGGAVYMTDTTAVEDAVRLRMFKNTLQSNTAMRSGKAIHTQLIHDVTLINNAIDDDNLLSQVPVVSFESWGRNLRSYNVVKLQRNTIFSSLPANEALIHIGSDLIGGTTHSSPPPTITIKESTIKTPNSNRPALMISPVNANVSINERIVQIMNCNIDSTGFGNITQNAFTEFVNNFDSIDHFVDPANHDFRLTLNSPNAIFDPSSPTNPSPLEDYDLDDFLRDNSPDYGAYELGLKAYFRGIERGIVIKGSTQQLFATTTQPFMDVYCLASPFLLADPLTFPYFKGKLHIDPNRSNVAFFIGTTDRDGKLPPFMFPIPNIPDDLTMHIQPVAVNRQSGEISVGGLKTYRVVN